MSGTNVHVIGLVGGIIYQKIFKENPMTSLRYKANTSNFSNLQRSPLKV